MSDIAVMTDSNCGLLPEEGRRYGISILPMPVLIDGNTYYEGVDITSEMFYEKQKAGALITSSQPSPGDVMGMWDRLLKEHDEVVYIPMSSGLSQSCASSMSFAREEKYKGRVF
ncbi:MAG: DegV family protein, partial [[Clostridium] scindens]